MPYDGGSVIGLIILLNEVAVPHKTMQPMAYSAPASFLLKLNTNVNSSRYFSFFCPHPKWGGKKKNIARLPKS